MTRRKNQAHIHRRHASGPIRDGVFGFTASLALLLLGYPAFAAEEPESPPPDSLPTVSMPAPRAWISEAEPASLNARPSRPRPAVDSEADWSSAVRRGLDHDLRGEHDLADAIWDALEALDPSDAEPWIRRIETTYWRYYYDEGDAVDETRILTCIEEAKKLAEASLDADDDDVRARWLLGEGLMQEARFEAMRGSYLRAGTAGEKSRKHLERVLEEDPDHAEAPYQLGLYFYYSSMMPDAVRYVDWLWFVPKGNQERGLTLLDGVRQGDGIYATSAAFVLMSIYTYQEPSDYASAQSIVRGLRQEYPDNALIQFEELEILLKAGDYKALDSRALVLEARTGESPALTGRAMLARLWRARGALIQNQADEALAIALSVEPDDPELPSWGTPWAWLVRGQALDLSGERSAALLAYRSTLDTAPNDFNGVRPRGLAEAGIEQPYDPETFIEGPVMVLGE